VDSDLYHAVDKLALGLDADVYAYTALADQIFEDGVAAFESLLSSPSLKPDIWSDGSAPVVLQNEDHSRIRARDRPHTKASLSPNKTGAFYRARRAIAIIQAQVRMWLVQKNILEHPGGKAQWRSACNLHSRCAQAECLRALKLYARHCARTRAHWQSKFYLNPEANERQNTAPAEGCCSGVWIQQCQTMLQRFDRDGWRSQEGTMVMARQYCEWRRKALALCCWYQLVAYGR
jgi:hypothetical protein